MWGTEVTSALFPVHCRVEKAWRLLQPSQVLRHLAGGTGALFLLFVAVVGDTPADIAALPRRPNICRAPKAVHFNSSMTSIHSYVRKLPRKHVHSVSIDEKRY